MPLSLSTPNVANTARDIDHKFLRSPPNPNPALPLLLRNLLPLRHLPPLHSRDLHDLHARDSGRGSGDHGRCVRSHGCCGGYGVEELDWEGG